MKKESWLLTAVAAAFLIGYAVVDPNGHTACFLNCLKAGYLCLP